MKILPRIMVTPTPMTILGWSLDAMSPPSHMKPQVEKIVMGKRINAVEMSMEG